MKTPLRRIILFITLLVLTAGQAQAAWQQIGAAGFSAGATFLPALPWTAAARYASPIWTVPTTGRST